MTRALVLLASLRRRLGAMGTGPDAPHLVFFQHDEVIVHCPASQADAVAAAAAAYFAMLDASPAGRPLSCSHAALAVIRAASSTAIFALASGCETPWWVPIGTPQTCRSRA